MYFSIDWKYTLCYNSSTNSKGGNFMEENKNSFDKESFANLILKAKGSRTMTKFAEDSDMSVAHISRMVNQKLETAPSPETIKKLLPNGSSNGVTYEDLMIAAGHITAPMAAQLEFEFVFDEDTEEQKPIVVPRYSSDEKLIMEERDKRWEIQRIQEREDRIKFQSMCMSMIMSQISSLPFPWRIENDPNNRSFSFSRNLQINLIESPARIWHFEFKHFRNPSMDYDRPMRISPSFALNTWGRLAMLDLPNDLKYSIVTDSIEYYEMLFKRKPRNLDLNISIILIDIDNFRILKEQYVSYNHEADIEWLDKLRIATEYEY